MRPNKKKTNELFYNQMKVTCILIKILMSISPHSSNFFKTFNIPMEFLENRKYKFSTYYFYTTNITLSDEIVY